MFQEYFGIPEDPFSITPDTKYLYLSERHRIAYAHLRFGLAEGGGFVQLTGEVGTGKTLLCRKLMIELTEDIDLALIFNPRQTPLELVATLCDELKIEYPRNSTSIKEVVDALNAALLHSQWSGRRTVLIIDEAQNLSYEALEQLRLLTNLETAKEKLLQIILVGQPELRSLLARPELRQLAQRITARYHLTPLTAAETKTYVLHRLKVVGYQHPLFTGGALNLLYRLTGGVPRLINVICSRAMLATFGSNRKKITRSLLKSVAREVQGSETGRPTLKRWVLAGGVAVTALITLIFMRESIQQQFDGFRLSPVWAAFTEKPPPGTISTQKPDPESLLPSFTDQPAVRPDPPADVEPHEPIPQSNTSSSETAEKTGEAADFTAQTESPPTLVGLLGDVNNAFTTLFTYWETTYPTDDNSLTACERAERVGLSCIYGKGSWEKLELYNRPAVIELRLDRGELYHVVVTQLDAEHVTLDLEDRRTTFTRGKIERLWTGSYIVLWRPPKIPPPYLLSVGDQGEGVAWLVSALDRVEGRPERLREVTARFDPTLKERVVHFQQANGLLTDGVVGKHTLMQLNALINQNGTPVLRRVGS